MRTLPLPLLVLALAACRKDPADAKPSAVPMGETGLPAQDTGDTGDTGDDSSGSFDTDPVADADGFTVEQGDCDDADPAVRPGAFEACDGVDNDCDGAIDEEGLTAWYADADGDGFGDVETGELDCAAEGRVSDWTTTATTPTTPCTPGPTRCATRRTTTATARWTSPTP